jgi:Tol biopolymer transport system component
MGTAPYMSPEQARGEAVDRRADVWSFGCVLYEMLAGGRAFPGHTAEAVAALLERDPVWQALPSETPPKATDLLRRCLQKDRNRRLHDVADARIELEEALSEPVAVAGPSTLAAGPTKGSRRWRLAAFGLLTAVGLTALGFEWGRRTAAPPLPKITRLTFRPGHVGNARFTPDGQTVLYSGQWGTASSEVVSQRVGANDVRALPLGPGNPMVQATTGAEALVTILDYGRSGPSRFRLVRTTIESGSTRELTEGVWWADWSPDHSRIAVSRLFEGRYRLEYPVGRVLFEASGKGVIQVVKVSPSGQEVAFIHWPVRGGGRRAGDLMLADSAGRVRVLSGGWSSLAGIAWSPDGREVWFTAAREGSFHPQSLHAVDLSGRQRTILRLGHSLVLTDVGRDGRVLALYESRRIEARGRLEGDVAERDLSWFDRTAPVTLGADAGVLVFGEQGEAGGPLGATYLWRVAGALPVRLSEGLPLDVSPDGGSVVCLVVSLDGRRELRLVPTGVGEPRRLPAGDADPVWARFLPDGKRLVVRAAGAGRPGRVFIQDLPDGAPRPLLPDGWAGGVPTPDGRGVSAKPPGDGPTLLQPLDGGEPRPIPGVRPRDEIVQFSADGRVAFAEESCGAWGCRYVRLDLGTGRRSTWLDMRPPDETGLSRYPTVVNSCAVHPSGRYYAYSYERVLSDLYLIEGLK